MKVGVAKETAPGERRVALVPESLGRLTAAGLEVLVETGAGAGASLPDQAYVDAGAKVVSTRELYDQSDVILRIQKPGESEIRVMRTGQAVLGLLQPLIDPQTSAALAKHGVTAISLDAIPRTLSRAQSMDALSSQANVGGYKAVLIAANEYGRYFPLLTTAAGTAKPANVLILGIGVAGLQAIGTARRLGAVVKAYDVRPETREQAESLGAQFVKLKTTIDATGTGGYARELTPEERAAQQAELNDVIGGMDIVITTAQVPGRKPPVLVTADAVGKMKPGSVIVDMAGSALGRRDRRDRQRRDDHLARQPAGDDAGRRVGLLRPEHLVAPARDGQGRPAEPGLRGRGDEGNRDHEGRRGDRRACQEAPRAGPGGRHWRPGVTAAELNRLLQALTVFTLAILVGIAVISKVPATLHTPLMSGANSIHGIVLVGAMLIAAEATEPISQFLSLVAVAFATMNVVGGYVVTDRMLQMFRKKPVAAKPASDDAEAGS